MYEVAWNNKTNVDEVLQTFWTWAVQEFVDLVDLVKSFPTISDLHKLASMRPSTSLSRFNFRHDRINFSLPQAHTSVLRAYFNEKLRRESGDQPMPE